MVSIHTNGLQPLRIRLDPSTREKCGGESDYVGVNHPDLTGDAYWTHQTNALHLLSAAMRQRERVTVHLAAQYDDSNTMSCLASAVRTQPPPTNDNTDDGANEEDGSNEDGCSIVRNNGGAINWNAALAHAPSCFEQHDGSNSALPTRSHRMAPNIGARPSQTSTSLETTLRTVAKTPSTTQSRLVKRRAIGTARFIVPTLAVPTTLEVEDNGK